MKSEEVVMKVEVLKLAGMGYRLFPVHTPVGCGLCSCGNPTCVHQGKHPRIRNWQNLATTDPAQIHRWWGQWPNANIGVVTDSIVVVDIDPRSSGDKTFKKLVEDHGMDWETATVHTGGGGLHFWFTRPENCPIKSGVNKLGPGVDIKTGSAAYAIAPPSLHVSGRRYRWA